MKTPVRSHGPLRLIAAALFATTAIASTAIATTALSPVYADINVRFSEGAPKDRFSFKNDSACDLTDLSIEIDLSASSARLIFDTTGEGAGVEGRGLMVRLSLVHLAQTTRPASRSIPV